MARNWAVPFVRPPGSKSEGVPSEKGARALEDVFFKGPRASGFAYYPECRVTHLLETPCNPNGLALERNGWQLVAEGRVQHCQDSINSWLLTHARLNFHMFALPWLALLEVSNGFSFSKILSQGLA